MTTLLRSAKRDLSSSLNSEPGETLLEETGLVVSTGNGKIMLMQFGQYQLPEFGWQ